MLCLPALDAFLKGKLRVFPHFFPLLLQIQVTLHFMMPRKDRACTKLQEWDCTDSAWSKCNFFLLVNTLLERTLVGAWIAIFQKTVASWFFISETKD